MPDNNWTLISGSTPQDYTDTAVFEVNPDTKQIALITGQALVAGEKDSQYISFLMPRYWDGIDISDKTFTIEYALAGTYYGTSEAVNAEMTTEQVRFGWIVPETACAISGTLLFVLKITSEDYVLKTKIAEHPVFKTIRVEDVVPEPTKEAWYIEFQTRVDGAISEAETAVETAQATLTQVEASVGLAQTAVQEAQTAEDNAEAAAASAQIRYGSPLTATTAEEMTDKNRVYVYVGSESGYTNGNWYYYDGTAWVSGGVYNGTGINTDTTLTQSGMAADAKATGDEISQIKEDLSDTVDLLNSTLADYTKGIENIGIGHVFVNGGMTSGQVVPSIKYRVATDEIIVFDRNIILTVASGFRMGIHFFDSEGTYTKETGWRQGSYTINAGQGFKIVISRTTESGSEVADITEFTSKVTYESDTEYRLSQLDDATDDLTAEVYKTITPQITDTATGKYISTRGVIGTLSFGAYSTAIPVLKGDKLNLRCVANTSMSAISYCYDDLTHITPAVLGASYNVTDYTLVADRTGYVVLSYYKDSEHNLTINRSLHDKTVLFEKQTIWCGDSIMRGNAFNDSKSGWSGRIADTSRCMYKNYAEGGACITRGVSQTGKTAVVDQIENAYNDYPDADYIIFDGGCNDADLIGNATGETKPEAFGTFSENDFSGNYDATTFCGAMETICMKLSQHWLGKHIGYVVPHKMGVSNNYHAGHNNYRTYYETAIQICAKWGVSVLNLWDGSYLNPKHNWMCDTNNTMTVQEIYDAGFLYADRQHLTSAGYDYEAPRVMEWMQGQ